MNKNYKKINKILEEFEKSIGDYGYNLKEFCNDLEKINKQISEKDPIKSELIIYISSFKKIRKYFASNIYNENELTSRNNLIKIINGEENAS